MMRAGGIAMLYARNVPFFQSPEESSCGVTSPISFPVMPAFLSASTTFSYASVSLYVTVSRSMILNGLSAAPRFFARLAMTSFSSAESDSLSICPFSAAAAFFNNSLTIEMRFGRGLSVMTTCFSSFIFKTPSFAS